ncbi:Cof-type HAD-IIB family hydrolase [Enterococcus sp. CWB-B31]|uniref:Cof-type HAD-IIB family hydrolase n=1 Tax=Enterococcus sp. CWB-B31 TaxID=2885159 RepID=UPI001E4AC8B4|nr:Cof-type HAD-IIB family hydrolase [Enterococcus sp. CWB-B31]MCB5954089.1 Cof-type HAD-IIB family hydrolase [Enterococcus sp. CWB-B31]
MNVVFCDIDGTFQDIGGEIPKINFDGIDALQNQGDHFVFISGRGYDQLRELLSQLTNDCDVIFSNGAGYRLMGEEPVYRSWLSLGICREIVSVVEERNIFYFIHTDNGIIMKSDRLYRAHYSALRKRLKPMGETGTRIMDFKEKFFAEECQHVDDPVQYLSENSELKILKIEIMEADDEELECLRNMLNSETTHVFSSYYQCLEVVNPLSSKGHAVRHFMTEFSGGRSYGIGDGENDLAMLDAVDVPVAVENASEAVKAKARIITDHCANGGVGKFIFDHLITSN